MQYPAAFSFSSVYSLGFLPCAGLRLWVLHRFQAFLACSPCAASATSYHFSSSASPPWRTAFSWFAPVVNLGLPVLASGSNRAVKPTCLRQAAYFRSLVATDYEIRNSTIEGSHVGDSFNREGRYCSGPETYRLSSWAMGERLLEGGHGDSGQTGRWSHIPARKLVRAIPLRGPNQRLHDPQCPRK